jgi:hypothetical protein
MLSNYSSVQGKLFYHVSTTPEGTQYFDSNDTFQFTNDVLNPRSRTLLEFKKTIKVGNVEMGFLKSLDYFKKQLIEQPWLSYDWYKIIEDVRDTSYRLNNRYFETILERVRSKEFPNLPSRYSCLYLTDEDNLTKWYEKALTELEIAELPIFQFKVSGNIHYADSTWLEVDVVSEVEYIDTAHKYWTGESNPDNNETPLDILFCGSIKKMMKFQNIREIESLT